MLRDCLRWILGGRNHSAKENWVYAEQQGNPGFKALVEEWLRRLDQVDLKRDNHKKPRRGEQWKGKVKIAEDFDELPESFMEVFHGDNE